MDRGLFLFAGQNFARGIQRVVGFAYVPASVLFGVARVLFGLAGRIADRFYFANSLDCRIQRTAQIGQAVALF